MVVGEEGGICRGPVTILVYGVAITRRWDGVGVGCGGASEAEEEEAKEMEAAAAEAAEEAEVVVGPPTPCFRFQLSFIRFQRLVAAVHCNRRSESPTSEKTLSGQKRRHHSFW